MPTLPIVPTADAFRFATLRPATKKRRTAISIGFVTFSFFDSISVPVLAGIEATQPLLFSRLMSVINSPTPRADMEKEVETFRAISPNYISNEKTLNAKFPNFDLVLAVIEDNKTAVNTNQLKNKIEAILGVSIANYISNTDYLNKKLRLWDNLFSLMVNSNNSYLRELIINTIKVLNLMERINLNDDLLKDGGIKKAVDATIILPNPLFPIPKIINVIPESTPVAPVGNQDIIDAQQKVTALTKALDDVTEIYNIQQLNLRQKNYLRQADPNSPPLQNPRPSDDPNTQSDVARDLMYLSVESFNQLKDITKTVLTTLKISQEHAHIPFIFERINEELKNQGRKAYSQTKGETSVVLIGGVLIDLRNYCLEIEDNGTPCDPYTGVSLPKGSGSIKPAGIADLLVVKQQLLKYELGEVAHIENIMLTEKKGRTHRQLNREEDTFTSETETTKESERDTQTTERFGIEKESSNIAQEDQSLEAGVTISASYGGMVSITAGVNYATSSSSISSSSVATQYAKSITERAIERIKEKVRTSRTKVTISETEETNLHEFDNTNTALPSASHVIGQYHWVDKFYLNQIVNYGKRLMYEFIIPEPASFYIFAKTNKPSENNLIVKPVTLEEIKLTSHKDINTANYSSFISIYGVQGLTPPPTQFQTACTTITNPVGPNFSVFSSKDLKVPTGYLAKQAYATVGSDWNGFIQLRVGRHALGGVFGQFYSTVLDNETDIVPVTGYANYNSAAYINIEIVCERSPELYEEWQLKTYQAIIEAYNKKQSDYESALAGYQTSSGVAIYGNNPEINREIERTELKKGCIELLTDQKFDAFDAMRQNQPTQGYPEFKNSEAKAEGGYIQFFEQAFEWSQMTYIFYPYFWGRKNGWTVKSLYQDNDPLFTNFLQAGAVRVVIPVRPNFTEAVLHYAESGNIWNGASVPTIADPLFVSIIDEIKTATGDLVGTNVGDPWITKIPTNLVKLATGINPPLPDNSVALGV